MNEEQTEGEEPTIDKDEIGEFKEGVKSLSAFCKKNHYRIIAVGMLVIALAGMWFCYEFGFRLGAVTICENSGGIPLLKNSNDIKDGQCLIKYDDLSEFDNNLGLSDVEVMRFEEGLG